MPKDTPQPKPSHSPPAVHGQPVTSPLAKFAIGAAAGIAAVAIPRITPLVTMENPSLSGIFTNNFLYLIVALAVLLGGVITIVEYGNPRLPKETFFAALAIPSLLAGALNTGLVSQDLSVKQNQIDVLTNQVQKN